jgi:murein L,D-transpeptidase YcbB/YkuD
MQKMTILTVASLFAAAPALADNPPAATGAAPPSARPAGVTPHPHAAPAKQAAPASTPEQRSAAALALTHEPTYDEGTAQRIREAAFSYSDIAVRGGWPEIPAAAKFAVGIAGQHDDLLRKRLLISGDLAGDKGTGAHDETVVEALKRFQSRHGFAPTGTMTPRTLAQQRNLFNNDYRFDSHGCSRVDNVRDLAAWLLKDQPKWNRAAIDATIASGQHLDIPVSRKVPVAWVYLTAWMTKDQTVHFRNDVYAQDEHLLEATAEEAAFMNNAADHPLGAHLVQ